MGESKGVARGGGWDGGEEAVVGGFGAGCGGRKRAAGWWWGVRGAWEGVWVEGGSGIASGNR